MFCHHSIAKCIHLLVESRNLIRLIRSGPVHQDFTVQETRKAVKGRRLKRTPLGIVALIAVAVVPFLRGEPGPSRPDPVVEQYVWATQDQSTRLRGASMEVDIRAQLPKLRRIGHLHALRNISRLGRITYEALRFDGDRSVKTDVIARYLKAEVQAAETRDPSLAITPANYKFRYKARLRSDAVDVYVYQLTPRKKRVGLFKGELWIDAVTYLPIRESGRFVKSPSVFLKRMEFVREYDIIWGVAVPKRIQSLVDTRIVGRAELSIDFVNFSWSAESQPIASLPGSTQ
jgi:hypothetical protein